MKIAILNRSEIESMVQGDSYPALRVQVLQDNGIDPYPLTDGHDLFLVVNVRSEDGAIGANKFKKRFIITNAASGLAEYRWANTQTLKDLSDAGSFAYDVVLHLPETPAKVYAAQKDAANTGDDTLSASGVFIGNQDTVYNLEVTTQGVFSPGVKEVVTITTIADSSGSLNNKYFLLSDTHYVWFNVNGAGGDPALSGLTGIEVPIPTDATEDDVATALRSALDTALSNVTVTGAADQVVIEFDTPGNVADTADSGGSTATGFTIVITTQGNAVLGTIQVTPVGAETDVTYVTPQKNVPFAIGTKGVIGRITESGAGDGILTLGDKWTIQAKAKVPGSVQTLTKEPETFIVRAKLA
jgi:hypothetical protein